MRLVGPSCMMCLSMRIACFNISRKNQQRTNAKYILSLKIKIVLSFFRPDHTFDALDFLMRLAFLFEKAFCCKKCWEMLAYTESKLLKGNIQMFKYSK